MCLLIMMFMRVLARYEKGLFYLLMAMFLSSDYKVKNINREILLICAFFFN